MGNEKTYLWPIQKAVIQGDSKSEQVGKAAGCFGILSSELTLVKHKVAAPASEEKWK